jgi:hypothetical protein
VVTPNPSCVCPTWNTPSKAAVFNSADGSGVIVTLSMSALTVPGQLGAGEEVAGSRNLPRQRITRYSRRKRSGNILGPLHGLRTLRLEKLLELIAIRSPAGAPMKYES